MFLCEGKDVESVEHGPADFERAIVKSGKYIENRFILSYTLIYYKQDI